MVGILARHSLGGLGHPVAVPSAVAQGGGGRRRGPADSGARGADQRDPRVRSGGLGPRSWNRRPQEGRAVLADACGVRSGHHRRRVLDSLRARRGALTALG